MTNSGVEQRKTSSIARGNGVSAFGPSSIGSQRMTLRSLRRLHRWPAIPSSVESVRIRNGGTADPTSGRIVAWNIGDYQRLSLARRRGRGQGQPGLPPLFAFGQSLRTPFDQTKWVTRFSTVPGRRAFFKQRKTEARHGTSRDEAPPDTSISKRSSLPRLSHRLQHRSSNA